MEQFFNQFGVWLGTAAAAAVGFVAIYGVFDTKFRDRRKEADSTEDRIIKLLQTEIGELTKRVEAQAQEVLMLRGEISVVKAENLTLMKVLQGRDDRAEKFYAQAADNMAISKQTNEIVKALSEDVRSLIAVLQSQ